MLTDVCCLGGIFCSRHTSTCRRSKEHFQELLMLLGDHQEVLEVVLSFLRPDRVIFLLKGVNLCSAFTPSSIKATAHLLGANSYLEEGIVLGASLPFQFHGLGVLEKVSIIPQTIPNLGECSWTLKSFN